MGERKNNNDQAGKSTTGKEMIIFIQPETRVNKGGDGTANAGENLGMEMAMTNQELKTSKVRGKYGHELNLFLF